MAMEGQPKRMNKFFEKAGIAGKILFSVFILLGTTLVFLRTEVERLGSRTAPIEDIPESPVSPVQEASNLSNLEITRPIILHVRRKNGTVFWKVLLGILSLGLLAGVSYFFWNNNGLEMVLPAGAAPEAIHFEATNLQPGQFMFTLRNSTPKAITITTANINESILPFVIKPDKTIPPLGKATLYITYPWVQGEAYNIDITTSDSSTFHTIVDSASATPPLTTPFMLNLTLIGLIIGLIPMFIGMTWFPVITRAGAGLYLFLMALAVGLLVYLGIAVANQALENTQGIGGAFQGIELLVVGSAVTFALLHALGHLGGGARKEEKAHALQQAWMVTTRISLQNLAEGLAVGAIFSFGVTGLGFLLIVGLIFQNLVEGLRLIASMEKEERSLLRLFVMGLMAGIPAILGIWIGGATDSQLFQIFLFSIGAGAVFESVYSLYMQIHGITVHQPKPFTVFLGFAFGLMAIFAAGMFIF